MVRKAEKPGKKTIEKGNSPKMLKQEITRFLETRQEYAVKRWARQEIFIFLFWKSRNVKKWSLRQDFLSCLNTR